MRGAPELRDREARTGLRRALDQVTPTASDRTTWDEPAWDDDMQAVLVRCESDRADLEPEHIVSTVASAVARVLPGSEATVAFRGAGVVVPPRYSPLSHVEKHGWYSVTLELRAPILAQDPEATVYIAEQLAQMRRFRRASFLFDSSTATGHFTVETFAISQAAADGEARDSLENLLWSAVLDPGQFGIGTVNATWIDPDAPRRTS